MRTVLLESTATDYGIHRLLQLAYGCPRRAQLGYGIQSGHSKATLIGSMLHLYLEYYYQGIEIDIEIPPEAIDALGEEVVAKCLATASATFEAYKLDHGPKDFGRVLGTEEAYEVLEPPKNFPLPTPYSMRIDMRVRITKKGIGILKEKFGLWQIDEPGVYITDHKSSSSNTGLSYERELHGLQGAAYLACFNSLQKHKTAKAKGLIYNFLITTKKPQFLLGFRRAETTIDKMLLTNLKAKVHSLMEQEADQGVHTWNELLQQERPLPTNPSRCYDWFRTCSYFKQGYCNRV